MTSREMLALALAFLVLTVIFHPIFSYAFTLDQESQLTQIKSSTSPNIQVQQSVFSFSNSTSVKLNTLTQQNSINDSQVSSNQSLQQINDEINRTGTARILIGLNIKYVPEGEFSRMEEIQNQRTIISNLQNQTLQSLAPGHFSHVKQFKHIPFLALQIDADSLKKLSTSRFVTSIYKDEIRRIFDTNTIPLTGTNNAWVMRYTGQGQTIAILDTGVDGSHPFLNGKVVSEACYSTVSLGTDASLCPNGLSSQIGPGSAVPCSNTLTNCYHGTFVAGVAAGNDPTNLPGVAKDANIIAVQVFHKANDATSCGASSPPCIVAYDSDILSGLQQVYNLRTSFNIAAVNLSLGGSGYTSNCDSLFPSYKTMFDTLQSVGIASVVASGNNGYVNALSAPACVSSAISVGSTNNADQVSSFTNSASFLSLLAPGESITSSVPGGGIIVASGTSFAAPHVAGTWAILKQESPSSSVSTILSTLKTTGKSVIDSRNNLSFPRIRVDYALQIPCSPPLSGDWIISSSCLLESNISPSASVIVQNNAIMTIPGTFTLNIDFTLYHLLVQSGSGIYIDPGGKIS